MVKVCPSCGTKSSGKFCSQCGTPLDAAICASCGNPIPEGGRFCNMCGTPVAAAGRKGGGKRPKAGAAAAAVPVPAVGAGAGRNLPWFVAGAAVVALAVVLVMSRGDSEPEAPFAAAPVTGPAATPPAGDPSAIDLSSMTPREAADRLFERVMTAVSSGDTAQARAFAPMAVAAYEMVGDLDLDGHYHVAAIHLVNNEPAAALEAANLILAEVPTHLFGHFTAAEAEQMLGDTEAAAAHYRQFLENFDAEVATGRTEYEDHAPVLPGMRDQATQMLGGA